MGVAMGSWVTAHLGSGDAPALVTRANPDGTVSISIFVVGDVVYRDNVAMYVPEPDDEDHDKIGYWSL